MGTCRYCLNATGDEFDVCDAPVCMEKDAIATADECPWCGGEATVLGTLGKLEWFRCRNCGEDFSDNDQQ